MSFSLFSIYPPTPSTDRDELHEINKRLNLVLTTLTGVNTQMATIHDDIGILKAEVVSLLQVVTAGLGNIADNLTTSSEKADVETSIAQIQQVKNAVQQATAVITTPPPTPTPTPTPIGEPPTPTTPPADTPPTTTLIDPALAAAIRG